MFPPSCPLRHYAAAAVSCVSYIVAGYVRNVVISLIVAIAPDAGHPVGHQNDGGKSRKS